MHRWLFMPVSSFHAQIAFLLLLTLVIPSCARGGDGEPALAPSAGSQPSEEPDAPGVSPAPDTDPASPGIHWRNLFLQSFEFLGLEHGFRYATEESTRHPHRPFFRGYANSLENLHGWADGDSFSTNYLGHSMQGAVSGFIFVQNDGDYRDAVFGRNRQYWKSRLRAAAWALAYSEQFEIGPLSEASVGNVQAAFPQQGFADQVVSPAVGLGWMIAEDAIDRSLVRSIESHTENRYVRIVARSALNPSRSLANLMGGKLPWYRDRHDPMPSHAPPAGAYPVIPSFEFLATARLQQIPGDGGRGICVGGGGTGAFRLSPNWQLVGDVNGCKLLHLQTNVSGDSLTWMIGLRRIWNSEKRWHPYAQILAGGRKMTWEEIDPVKKAQVEALAAQTGKPLDFSDHFLYTHVTEATGLAVTAAAGLDVRVNSAIGIRVGAFGYTHSWHSRFDGIDYSHSIEITSGFILRWGTW